LNADPKRFSGRDTKRILTFLKKDVLPDVQKFSSAINKTKIALDTGNASEDDILCMAIAYHVNKTYAGDTRFMTTGKNRFQPESLWDNYLAYLELRKSPKFDSSPSKSVMKTPPKLAAAATTNDGDVVGEEELGAVATGISFDQYEQPSRTTGQKKAKLELKEANDKKEATKMISDKMDKMIDAQQFMCAHLKTCGNEKKIRLLKAKYKLVKLTDRSKSASL
jgi:hypothetical protein